MSWSARGDNSADLEIDMLKLFQLPLKVSLTPSKLTLIFEKEVILTALSLGPRAIRRTSLADAPKWSLIFVIVSAVSFLANDDFHLASWSKRMAMKETSLYVSLTVLVNASMTLLLRYFCKRMFRFNSLNIQALQLNHHKIRLKQIKLR